MDNKTDKQKLIDLGKWLTKVGYVTEKEHHTVGFVEVNGQNFELQFYQSLAYSTYYSFRYGSLARNGSWAITINGIGIQYELNGAEDFVKPDIDAIVKLFMDNTTYERELSETEQKQKKADELAEQLKKLRKDIKQGATKA